MLEAIDLPNLLNGVSRQPANLRLASQGQEQVNGVSDIVKGLRKRPGTEHLLSLTGLAADTTFHVINRDADRRYLLATSSGSIKAWNLNSLAAVTVNTAVGTTYLTGTGSPKDYLKFLTVADYTFVLNKQKVPAMTAANTGRPNYAAIITFQTLSLTFVDIFVDGVRRAHVATANPPQLNATVNDLVAALRASLGTVDWNIQDLGSAIYIERLGGVNFSLTADGGTSDGGIKVIKEKIQDFGDLPYRGWDGFKVNVVGSNATNFDDFWVRFDSDGNQETGVWQESNAHNLTTTLNDTLLPHALVINAAGTTLTFQRLPWGQRLVGGEDSAPLPSFTGRSIADIFFFRNRLGFLSDENVLLSESGEFFNFFPTTVTDILDSDNIDVGTSHTQVSVLKHAVPVANRCLVFADRVQFMDQLDDSDLLTPKTAAFTAVSEYESEPKAPPVTTKQSVFFAQKNGEFVRMFEMFPDAARSPGDDLAVDVTEHTPDYIPKNVRRMAFHQSTSTLFVLSDDDPKKLYVYRYLWQEKKRVQASWSLWDLDDGMTGIEDFFIIDSEMFVIRKGTTTTDFRLSKINLDLQADRPDVLAHNILLDNKQLIQGVYDSVNDRTTWTLPLVWPTTTPFVALRGSGFADGVGSIVQNTTRPTTTTVRASGDHSESGCILGTPYGFRYEFSRFYMRDQDGQAMEDGRTVCKSATLYLEDTGYLKAEVIRKDQTRTYEITGLKLANEPIVNTPPISSGEFRVPLHSNNENVRLVLSSDSPYPVQITKARIIVDYTNLDRNIA